MGNDLMARILLLSTGGTIASNASAPGGPVTAKLSGAELMAGIELPAEISVDVLPFPARGSNALSLRDALGFARAIEREMADYDGFVLTHGTDTMEDTAWALEFLLAPQKPVVLTGAQRHAGEADSDGPRNLRDAVIAAAYAPLGAAGVVVVFEGDIHGARAVRKAHTSRVDAFRSGDLGKIGSLDQGRVSLRALPRRAPGFGTAHEPREVALIAAAFGAGAEFLDFACSRDYGAVVLQGFGRGNFPDGWAQATSRLVAAGKPVIIASRCSEGEVWPIYGNDSGGTSMAAAGALFGGDLSPGRLRILAAFVSAAPGQSLAQALEVWAS